MRKFLKDNRGFTLVEMLVAAMMLAVIMVPLMRPFFVSLNATQRAVTYGRVTESVENAIEVVKAANIDTMLTNLENYYGADKVDDLSGSSGQFYEVTNGDETIEVTVRAPDDALDGDLLAELNDSDLASFTNMDLALIQVAGSVSDGSGGYTLKDVDEATYLYFCNIIGAGYTVDPYEIHRTIRVTLTSKGEEEENGGNVGILHYDVDYEYSYTYVKADLTSDTLTKKVDQFSGTVSTGGDGIIALQLVYIPMNNSLVGENREKIVVDYLNHLPVETDFSDPTVTYDNYGLRFFLIKQQRMTHSISCAAYHIGGFRGNQVVDEDFECGTCAGESYENNYYSSFVYVNEGKSSYSDLVMGLHGNINVNMYSGETIDRVGAFNFYYAESGSYQDKSTEFKDKLVVDTSGDRISIVEVRTFNDGTETGYMKTVKLN